MTVYNKSLLTYFLSFLKDALDPVFTLLTHSLPRHLFYFGRCNMSSMIIRARHLQETADSVASGTIPE